MVAHHFADQYGLDEASMEIRGSVLLEGGQACHLAAWWHVAGYDLELGLVGLGDEGAYIG